MTAETIFNRNTTIFFNNLSFSDLIIQFVFFEDLILDNWTENLLLSPETNKCCNMKIIHTPIIFIEYTYMKIK